MQKVLNESQPNHYRANTVHSPFIIMNHLTALKKRLQQMVPGSFFLDFFLLL